MFVLIGLALLMVVFYSLLRSRREREAAPESDRDIVWRGGRRQLTEDAARRMVVGRLEERKEREERDDRE